MAGRRIRNDHEQALHGLYGDGTDNWRDTRGRLVSLHPNSGTLSLLYNLLWCGLKQYDVGLVTIETSELPFIVASGIAKRQSSVTATNRDHTIPLLWVAGSIYDGELMVIGLHV